MLTGLKDRLATHLTLVLLLLPTLSGCGGSSASSDEQPTPDSVQHFLTAQDDLYYFPLEEGDVVRDYELSVATNDSWSQGQNISLKVLSAPRYGELELSSSDALVFVYQPSIDEPQVDRFSYTLESDTGDQVSAVVTLGLGYDAGSALLFDDEIVMLQGTSIEIDPLENDVLPGKTTINWLAEPNRLTWTSLDDGAIRLTAPASFLGSEQFQYTVEGASSGDSSLVSVSVYSDLGDAERAPQVLLPDLGLQPKDLAVIVNTDDLNSSVLALEYLSARNIPRDNMIELSLGTNAIISAADFDTEFSKLEPELPDDIQAFALMFTAPYRVDCMSTTSAFAFGGFDSAYCNTSGNTCAPTQVSNYFNADTSQPFEDYQLRPAMMVAGYTHQDQKDLMLRGVGSDQTFPEGDAYFMRTTDQARSVRWPVFKSAADEWNHSGAIRSQYIDASNGAESETLTGVDDVLFYFTGKVHVDGLDTLAFRPGAVADHLTSSGGVLTTTNSQMSSLEWLKAGATASYGTVVEPCNYTSKFPNVDVLMEHYYRGNTVLEAYWKSIQQPGEGVFIGEPLARPWGRQLLSYRDGQLSIDTTELKPGETYRLSAADQISGPFETVNEIRIDVHGMTNISIDAVDKAYYRLH